MYNKRPGFRPFVVKFSVASLGLATAQDVCHALSNPRTFSFEFFPAKTPEGMAVVRTTRQQLAQFAEFFRRLWRGRFHLRPHAGHRAGNPGNEVLRRRAASVVHWLQRDNIRAILNEYCNHGIRHIVALRGDIPSGMGEFCEFRFANELVESYLRLNTATIFTLEVAAYPEYHSAA